VEQNKFTCPVCGYHHLSEQPWIKGHGSLEVCSSCGTQFGYDDAAGGIASRRPDRHTELRLMWIARGSPWFSPKPPPVGWDPAEQLRRLRDVH
jgi:rubredoxin